MDPEPDLPGDEAYRGPAVLIADEVELPVRVHLLTIYQPLDNTVHWSGRVEPSAGLHDLHRVVNQPVRLRIGDRETVDGLLLDADPWGGSHIAGHGACPYPMPLEIP